MILRLFGKLTHSYTLGQISPYSGRGYLVPKHPKLLKIRGQLHHQHWRGRVFGCQQSPNNISGQKYAPVLTTRAEPLSFRAIKDLAPQKKTIIKIAL